MRYPVLASILFHAAIVAVGFVGLPALRSPPPTPEIPIVVELVDLGPITNLPTARELKKEEPKPAPPKVAETPEPPPPPPPKAKAPPPPPPPPVPAREEVAAVPPPPKPKPAPKKEPKPEPKPEPKKEVKKPEPKTPVRLAKAKPRRKPPPPDPFAGVLKTVERLKKQPPPEKKEEKKKAKTPEKKKDDFQQQIAKALSRRPTAHNPNRRISISERDALISAIRDQVTKCWSLPAGAKGAEDMIIEIKVAVNQDGRVRTANIANSGRMYSDPFYRAMAESALRAVLNPRCSPFKVPIDRYEVWKDLTLVFNPKEMFGG